MKMKLNKNGKLAIICLLIVIIMLNIIIFARNKKERVLMLDFISKDVSLLDEFCIDKCLVNKKYEYSIDYDKDKIIYQSKLPNEQLDKNSVIEVIVSKGLDYNSYQENNVNELGNVPIMMYHGIQNKMNSETEYTGGNIDKDGYQRTSEAFINDLEFYYKSGYRMIRLEDYVNGIIDVELGKSPIVLTFDDGLANNIKVTGLDESGEIIIDSNSAVGILESFKSKYPDYNVTATFFITSSLFNQKEYNNKIIAWLIKNGYDIGNHTLGHANIGELTEEETVKEIGKMYKTLSSLTKEYVSIVSLPYGIPYNSNHKNFKSIMSGTYDGFKYETISTLRVGWESNYSPFSSYFDKEFIKRIRAYDNLGKDFDIEYNFKMLENCRYISDGNSKTVVIKENDKEEVNATKLKIITY